MTSNMTSIISNTNISKLKDRLFKDYNSSLKWRLNELTLHKDFITSQLNESKGEFEFRKVDTILFENQINNNYLFDIIMAFTYYFHYGLSNAERGNPEDHFDDFLDIYNKNPEGFIKY